MGPDVGTGRGALPEAAPGAIAVVEEDGVRVLRLSGEIDSQVVAAYDGPAAPVLPAGAAVIDASAVTFLDCRGLGFLVRQTGAARRAGGRPVLRRPTRIVQRVIEMTGAGGCFTITL
jgi:anti-anti-sigma factor